MYKHKKMTVIKVKITKFLDLILKLLISLVKVIQKKKIISE